MELIEAQKEYKYEVAFSFLKEDLGLAQSLSDRLSDRLPTFIFTDRQDEVVGTEAMESFRQVYGVDARIVVILYRPHWGHTPYTRIENDAIRGRSFQSGPDFILLVKLDDGKPDWYSDSCIYVDFKRSSEDIILGHIEYIVKSRGGKVRPESVEDLALRKKRELEQLHRFERFYNSREGVDTAMQQFKTLKVLYETRREELKELLDGSGSRAITPNFIVTTIGKIALSFEWSHHITNSLRDARLKVELSNGQRFSAYMRHEHVTYMKKEYLFAEAIPGSYGWRAVGASSPVLVNETLLDIWMKQAIALSVDEQVKDIRSYLV